MLKQFILIALLVTFTQQGSFKNKISRFFNNIKSLFTGKKFKVYIMMRGDFYQ